MRLLVDSCLGPRLVHGLRQRGHDVEWVKDWPKDPGDREILAYAHATGRVVITADNDFGELVFKDGQPHCGVVRVVLDIMLDDWPERIDRAVRLHADALEAGRLLTLDSERTRVSRDAPPLT